MLALCLGSFDLDPRSTDHDGRVDTDPLAIHVHVRPPKCTCFSPSEARSCDQSNECGDPGIPCASDPQDRFDLVDTRRTDVIASLSEAPHREFGIGDGVGERVSTPLPGQPTGPMEDRPNAADPFLGKSRVLERPEVLLHVEWRQRCDPAATDRLLDTQGPHRLVAEAVLGERSDHPLAFHAVMASLTVGLGPHRADGSATGFGAASCSVTKRANSRSAARRAPRNRRWTCRTRPSLSRPTYTRSSQTSGSRTSRILPAIELPHTLLGFLLGSSGYEDTNETRSEDKYPLTWSFTEQSQRGSNPCSHLERVVS